MDLFALAVKDILRRKGKNLYVGFAVMIPVAILCTILLTMDNASRSLSEIASKFGFTLTIVSAVIGIAAGAVQGYFGGWTDLMFQRFIEVWSGLPILYLLIILASIVEPNFWWLLGIMLLFSWMGFVGVVRAEFLRARNFEYVRAARSMGVSDRRIMFRHILPNAMVATLTFMPFTLAGSVTVLTSLDFLGIGLPPGSVNTDLNAFAEASHHFLEKHAAVFGVRKQSEFLDNFFKIRAAQDLLGYGADTRVDVGRYNGLNVIRWNPLGHHEYQGFGFINLRQGHCQIHPDNHGDAKRDNDKPAPFDHQTQVIVNFKTLCLFSHCFNSLN